MTKTSKGIKPGFIAGPETAGVIPPTSTTELDEAVTYLQANKDSWTTLALTERINILDQCLEDLHAAAEEWVTAGMQAKGSKGYDFIEAEEWALLAFVFRAVRLLRQSLQDIQNSRRPRIPGSVDVLPNGQVRARVFPVDKYDSLIFSGMTAEVWMEPEVTTNEVLDGRARFYQNNAPAEQAPSTAVNDIGKVSLVLGSGNAALLVVTDFLYKLFVEGSVVLLKMNPVNAYMGPIIAKAFQPLHERGFMRIVYGGAKEGNYLCHHPDIDEIHMTGSDRTYEVIIFGPGEDGMKRKSQRRPLLEKPFTCELGNVTPVIVVPGPWTQKEIAYWGGKLASWLIINAGFNCLTPRVIVQSANWEHRYALNQAIGQALAQVKTRKAYYPGAQRRHDEFRAAHPNGQQYGAAGEGELPWTFIQDVNANNPDDICFKNEPFCGLFAETALDAENIPAFLELAVRFVNKHLWGNLTATVIVHPSSFKDGQVAKAVELAVTDLRYGMVLLNQYAGLGTFPMTTPWGAYPGNTIYDIQSGIGVTFNALMFDRPQKTVVRSPFMVSPDPFSPQSKTLVGVSRRLAELQYKPSIWKMPGMLWSAIRS